MSTPDFLPCRSHDHLRRRTLLKAAGMAGMSWLTPLSQLLAVESERAPKGRPARSVILLWLAGGPSQLETFDPHPGGKAAHGGTAIPTSVKDIRLGSGLPQTAELMNEIALVRSVVSKEGDHERAFYNIKTGYQINPTVVHASMGSIVAHQLPNPAIEIPTHVSIIPNQWPARGGYLGARYDAFRVGDPVNPVANTVARVGGGRQKDRLAHLDVVERQFTRGRLPKLESHRTQHRASIERALKMMRSDQLAAFNVNEAPASEREPYGDHRFGRACLAAVRLIETGVRCVEVTLTGWDTHANNAEGQAKQNAILDPAFSALIRDLKRRGLLDSTVVLCGGEFGRTPRLNGVDGRDHWPHGFSVALAGGGIRGGRVIGSTDPDGVKQEPKDPRNVEDLHATVLHALEIDPGHKFMTDVGRPLHFSQGRILHELLD
jgi:hypothetical protein